jgi:DNA helicase-2/ATP-dependent DNA helicase PcrA
VRSYELKPAAGRAPESRIRYEEELNPQQLAVVSAGDGPLLVIAGAGSGKTRTVTYRVARLIERGVDPASILLVTFTNKAAREMLRRVEHLLAVETRRVWGGTFHHVGHLVLRRHAKVFGYAENFGILDREDSKDLLEECAAGLRVDDPEQRFPKGDVLLEILSLALNTVVEPAALIERQFPQFLPVAGDLLRAFHAYAERKRRLNVMDFDDLLVLWRRLLAEHPEAREAWGRRFRYLLVDEYQDTNRLQGEIVDALASVHRNVMVVGDDAQSIYSFRGAHFANIFSFPKRYPDAQTFRLETNYRSTPQVLALANASIARNAEQFPKTLRAVRPDGPRPALIPARDGDEQARFVAQRVLEMRSQDIPLREIAVLYRAHYQSLEVQLELTRCHIPFEVRSGMRFFEQAHIKDVVAYLKVVANPRDEMAWKRVMRLYPRMGKATAEKLWRHLDGAPDPLAAAGGEAARRLVPRGAAAGWTAFTGLLARLAAPPLRDKPSEAIAAVLQGGYEDYARSRFENASTRIEDVRQLANFALRYESVTDFLSELALLSNIAGEEASEEADADRMVLSTVHQAKGLEWGAVFVIGLVDGAFPHGRCLREPGGEEEERRLFYVAVTRARTELYLAYPLIGRERGSWEIIQRPSRFIQELDKAAYETWNLTEGDAAGGADGIDDADPADGADGDFRPGRRRRGDGGLIDSDPLYE